AQVRETALEAYAHQDIPFEKLVEELAPARDLSRSPLFQVMFVLQNNPPAEVRLETLALSPLQGSDESAKFDLTLALGEQEGRLRGSLVYAADLFEGTSAERLVERLRAVLEAVVREPETRVGALPLLLAPERDALAAWTATTAPCPRSATVQALFEAQVDR